MPVDLVFVACFGLILLTTLALVWGCAALERKR